MRPAPRDGSVPVNWVLGNIRREELEGDETSKFSVLRLIDHTHPAATQLFGNAVMRDGLTNHELQ